MGNTGMSFVFESDIQTSVLLLRTRFLGIRWSPGTRRTTGKVFNGGCDETFGWYRGWACRWKGNRFHDWHSSGEWCGRCDRFGTGEWCRRCDRFGTGEWCARCNRGRCGRSDWFGTWGCCARNNRNGGICNGLLSGWYVDGSYWRSVGISGVIIDAAHVGSLIQVQQVSP